MWKKPTCLMKKSYSFYMPSNCSRSLCAEYFKELKALCALCLKSLKRVRAHHFPA